MAQIFHNDNYNIRAGNSNIVLNRGSEIVLTSIVVIGVNNFGITLTNRPSSSSPLTSVNILGSEDNSYYYFIQQNVFPGGVNAGQTLHFEFTTTSHYLQVIVNTAISATLDVYIVGTP